MSYGCIDGAWPARVGGAEGTGVVASVDASAMQGRRPTMEDRFVAATPCDGVALVGVFDGHGGAQVAEHLAQALPAALAADEAALRADPPRALRAAFAKLDEEAVALAPGGLELARRSSAPFTVALSEEGDPSASRSAAAAAAAAAAALENADPAPRMGPAPSSPVCPTGAGSTAVVALLLGGKAYFANVGDSRAVACSVDGNIVAATKDHLPRLEEERARIEGLGGCVRKGSDGSLRTEGVLAMTRAFGNAGLKHCVRAEPDITEVALDGVASIILVCDGITNVVRNEEIGEYVLRAMKATPPRRTARVLTSLARLRASTDNCTSVVVTLGHDDQLDKKATPRVPSPLAVLEAVVDRLADPIVARSPKRQKL